MNRRPAKILLSVTPKESMMTPPPANSRAALFPIVAALVAMLIAACTTVGTREGPGAVTPPAAPTQPIPSVPRNAEPPPPRVNLSGFPLPYRQGYADGCASVAGPEQKDAARFSSDMNYRTGWTDGRALCKK
jgi:hypothetical protein